VRSRYCEVETVGSNTTGRLKLALLASGFALLLSCAVVPFVHHWHLIYRTAWIDDPDRAGRVKQIAVVMPIYWFYVAAGLGGFLASLVTLGSEAVRTRRLILFLILCDVIYAWFGGIGYSVSLFLRAPDFETLHLQHTLHELTAAERVWSWTGGLLSKGLLLGLVFGNLATDGFGFVIGLPTVAWLVFSGRRKPSRTSSTSASGLAGDVNGSVPTPHSGIHRT
jgi:hypothetical protein